MSNPHAKALGKMGKGKPKNFSPEELEKRIERLRLAREKRWSKPSEPLTKALHALLPIESSQDISAVSPQPEHQNASGANAVSGNGHSGS